MTNPSANHSISRSDICAVIITFNPDNEFHKRLALVASQVGHVVVVDNHSSPDSFKNIRDAVTGKVELIENPDNLSIAAALNQGLQRASRGSFSWALTLDQDSVVDDSMTEKLIEIVNSHEMQHQIGVIGSNARSKVSSQLARKYESSNKLYIEEKTVITSGSLVSVRVYDKVGPFRNDFFIEGVDLEYCLRVRKHGFRVYCSREALMTHSGGMGSEHKFLGRVVIVANHSPWRYYYMVRNFMAIVRMYLFGELAWVLGSSLNFLKTFIKIAAFEENKFGKYKAAARGFKDGLFMRL